jgi:hypothetical protein
VYFIRHIYEVFSIFKKFKALVEKQNDRKIKVLGSDHGNDIFQVNLRSFVKMKVCRANNNWLYSATK